MNVLFRFTLRTLKCNRVRTLVTVIGIALSTALLTAVCTSVLSLQTGMLNDTIATEGTWHAYAPDVDQKTLETLKGDEHISDLVTFETSDSLKLAGADAFEIGDIFELKSLPSVVKGNDAFGEHSIAIMPKLTEGRYPQETQEVILPQFLRGEVLGQSKESSVLSEGPLAIGSAMSVCSPYEYVLHVVGFYEVQPNFLGSYYSASRLTPAVALVFPDTPLPEGSTTGFYAITQGFSTQEDIQGLFDSVLNPGDSDVLLHLNLLRLSYYAAERPMVRTIWLFAGLLMLVILAASICLIYNAFAISVAERTRQFGLLASLGASNKQLRRCVFAEALFLGIFGVPFGIGLGLFGTWAVFEASKEAFSAMFITGAPSICIDARALVFIAVLSAVTLIISAWIPAHRAARVSAVDAIRMSQDISLSKRACRKAAASGRAAAGVSTGVLGRVFGVPAFIAHRGLSRSTSRGHSVVASLAIGIALIVITGSVALYLDPISSRMDVSGTQSLRSDIIVNAFFNSDDLSAENTTDYLNDFVGRASKVSGAGFIGGCKEGSAFGIIPASLITEDAREAYSAWEKEMLSGEEGSSFAESGAYCGRVSLKYLDENTWHTLCDYLNLDAEFYSDPAHPRAVGYGIYELSLPDGGDMSVKAFTGEGVITLYNRPQQRAGYYTAGTELDKDGHLMLRYVNKDAGRVASPETMLVPIDEVAHETPLEIGALYNGGCDAVDLLCIYGDFPCILLPENVAVPESLAEPENVAAPENAAKSENVADFPAEDTKALANTPTYTYHMATFHFSAGDHAQVASEFKNIAQSYHNVSFDVYDAAEAERQDRLIVDAIQLFILCFSLIMVLVAVANVFNTLANGIILRTREFAVLQSVGMGGRAFVRMLVYECASYALRGFVVGMIIAVIVTYAFFRITRIGFADLTFTLPWTYVGVAVLTVGLVLALSVGYALHRSHAKSIVDALRADVL